MNPKARYKLVAKMNALTAGTERRSVAAAARLAYKIYQLALRGYRGSRKIPTRALRAQFLKLRAELQDAMLTSYLTGQVFLKEAAGLQLSATSGAVAVLKRRLALPKTQLVRIGKKFNAQALTVLETASATVEKKLQRAVLISVQKGEHVTQGVARLGKAFDAAGISPANSFQLEGIFRTQCQLAYSAGQWEAEQDDFVQEILWGYVYSTVGDDRVREGHYGLDGTKAEKDDPIWDTLYPPNGWACRCKVIPLFAPDKVDKPGRAVLRDGAAEGFKFNPGKVFAPEAEAKRAAAGRLVKGRTRAAVARRGAGPAEQLVRGIADEQGFAQKKLSVVNRYGPDKQFGRQRYSILGQFDPKTGKVVVYAKGLSANKLKHVAAHELGHATFHTAMKKRSFKSLVTKNIARLEKDDGSSKYSKLIWRQLGRKEEAWKAIGFSKRDIARFKVNGVNETVAELLAGKGKAKGVYKQLLKALQ